MIPWDYDKIEEYYYYPPEEYRYSHIKLNEYLGEEITTHYYTDLDKIPNYNDSNYLFGYFNSD